MNGFDLIVRLFSLLLGLSLAEVLGGFARTLRLKYGLTPVSAAQTRIGWLVPLLGLLVTMDQLSFWLSFYVLQDHIPLTFFSMIVVLFLVGGFYVASTLIFPAHPDKWPDFDAYYFRVKGMVVGALLALNLSLVVIGVVLVLRGDTFTPVESLNPLGVTAAMAMFPLLAMLVAARRTSTSLALLVASNVALILRAISMFY